MLYYVFNASFTNLPAGRQLPPGTSSRNKFQAIENNPIVPVPIISWASALTAVDPDDSRVDPRFRSPHDRKYIFPEPGIFANANERRRATYFTTWLSIEPACIYRLYGSSSNVTPLSNQEWRDILIGPIASKTLTSKAARAREHARQLLGSALDDLDIQVNDVSASAATLQLTDSAAQKILWQLTELNFRFELLSLDKRACSLARNDIQREDLLREGFKLQSLFVADAEQANSRLGSADWHERLPCLLTLRRMMMDWEGVKPAPLVSGISSIEEYGESDALRLEEAISGFYTDSFFRFFGRAPVIPACLP
jgi:hypothetical protein